MSWVPIIGPVFELASNYLENKKEQQAAKQKKILQHIENKADWEEAMARASDSSWKDEWFAVVFSLPLIGSFFPQLVPHIHEGFAALANTPEWYRYTIVTIVLASFGIRGYKVLKQ